MQTFSVPGRRPCSCPPPNMMGCSSTPPWRQYSAPMPCDVSHVTHESPRNNMWPFTLFSQTEREKKKGNGGVAVVHLCSEALPPPRVNSMSAWSSPWGRRACGRQHRRSPLPGHAHPPGFSQSLGLCRNGTQRIGPRRKLSQP